MSHVRRPPGAGAALHPEDWYDVALSGLLTALTLLTFASTFRGAGLWFVGLGAVLVGLAVAVAVVALRVGLEYVGLGLVLVYVLTAGPVSGAGLVGLDALGAGTTGTVEGWRLLVGTHPPIDASGPVLLPVAALCLLGAGLTAAVAMRSPSPGRPLAMQLVLLVAVLLLARAEAVGVLVQAAAFAVVAFGWLQLRARQTERTGQAHLPRLAAAVAMVLVALLGAGLLSGLASGDTDGATPLTERRVLRGVLPALDPTATSTPLDSFRAYTERRPVPVGNVYAERLLRVRGAPPGTRLRFAALDAYDGDRWHAADDTDPLRIDDRFLRLSSTLDNPADGVAAELVVTPLDAWALPWVPSAGAIQGFEFLGEGAGAATDRLRYDPATATGLMTSTLEPGTDYALPTVLPAAGADDVTAALEPSAALDPALVEAAAFLDPAVEAWSVGASGPVEAVLQVAARLRQVGRYSDGAVRGEEDYTAGHDEQRLGAGFVLATPTVGNDEQYAAAMALMANRLGVPARVVVGAVVPDNGVVTGRQVQAWVELRVADGTWRTLATERFMGDRPPPAGQDDQDDGTSPPERIFPEQTPDDVSPPREQPQQPEPDPAEPDTDDAQSADDGSAGDGSLWAVLRVVLLVLLVAALPGVVPALKWWRRRRRRTAEQASRRYAGGWDELVDTARDLGRPVPAGLTRPAQARVLEPAGAGSAHGLAAEADVRIWSAEEPATADAEAFWALVDAERSGLTARASRLRRVRALFSLASLRRR